MREGWRCPACRRINSPDLEGCPCSEGGAGVAAITPITPITPIAPGGTTIWTPPDTGITVTGGGGSTAGTTWQGVTFTASNAA